MRRIILALIAVLLLFACVGCQKQRIEKKNINVTITPQEETEKADNEINQIEQAKEKAEITSQPEEEIVNKIEDNSTPEQEEKIISKSVQLGGKETLGFAEIKFEKTSLENELYPKDTSGVYMYFEEEAGKKYFQLVGTIKNTSNLQYDIEHMCATFCFDDYYTFNAALAADAGQFRAFDHYVDPLNTVDFHLYVQIPNELANSFKSCVIQFGFSENFDSVYDFDECDYLYELKCTKR